MLTLTATCDVIALLFRCDLLLPPASVSCICADFCCVSVSCLYCDWSRGLDLCATSTMPVLLHGIAGCVPFWTRNIGISPVQVVKSWEYWNRCTHHDCYPKVALLSAPVYNHSLHAHPQEMSSETAWRLSYSTLLSHLQSPIPALFPQLLPWDIPHPRLSPMEGTASHLPYARGGSSINCESNRFLLHQHVVLTFRVMTTSCTATPTGRRRPAATGCVSGTTPCFARPRTRAS